MNLAGLFYETILLKDGVKMMDAATAYFLKNITRMSSNGGW